MENIEAGVGARKVRDVDRAEIGQADISHGTKGANRNTVSRMRTDFGGRGRFVRR